MLWGGGLAALGLAWGPGAAGQSGSLQNSPHLSFTASRSASYSSTNGPFSVSYEKRLRRLTVALTCPEGFLLKLFFSSSGQGPHLELFPDGVSCCLQSISPHGRLEKGRRRCSGNRPLSPNHTPEPDAFHCGHRVTIWKAFKFLQVEFSW